ncbi:MAG: DUF4416 family protein [Gemmatales bacterium]
MKFFVALLRGLTPPARILETLEQSWGPLDHQSQFYPFDQTDYYREEMGDALQRQLIAFAELRSPEELAAAKVKCIEIEASFSSEGKRSVNLDIGYLDHNKIVLASVKGLGQKIYLTQGIYADLVARYGHGRYQPFEWTFPDFKQGRYDADLAAIRLRYLDQLKERRQPH